MPLNDQVIIDILNPLKYITKYPYHIATIVFPSAKRQDILFSHKISDCDESLKTLNYL